MSIEWSAAVSREIEEHGAATYPNECCGALLGSAQGDRRIVRSTLRIENARADAAHHRFLITDQDYLAAEAHATSAGVSLLGFYHSHPDHPARPSQYDLDHAFPWFSYVILAVANGRPGALTSWRLSEDRTEFLPEPTLHPPQSGGA
ncbi:MAG: Mov34/MPN/PAD-1 family protein [Gemmatimonadota bacterium]|nr:MAG: Mov34/MPN/PAD-1 family protein [Gemmatimonadota bacterium]